MLVWKIAHCSFYHLPVYFWLCELLCYLYYLFCIICLQAVQPCTGDVVYDEFEDGPSFTELETRFEHIGPAEILLPDSVNTLTDNFIRGYVTRAQRFVSNHIKHLVEASLALILDKLRPKSHHDECDIDFTNLKAIYIQFHFVGKECIFHKNLKLGVVNAIVHMIYQQVISLGIFKGLP